MSSLPAPLARFRTELEDAISRELEAQRAARSNGWGARVLRAATTRPGRTALAFAAVTGAAVAALFATAPWKSSPGFLEEVQAAISPQTGTVLHMKVVMTEKRAQCNVTHPPVEFWVDLAPPYNWRAFDVKQTDICRAGTSREIGGQAGSGKPTLVFVPPDTLRTTPEYPNDPGTGPPDWLAKVRQAIDDGTAHLEGRTVLDGRTVERVRIDCADKGFPSCDPLYAYVDAETFAPVRTMTGPGLRPGPGASCTAECFFQDFATYEYLPGTPANRALADIRAQHPDATEP
jgi:hypothetical protein